MSKTKLKAPNPPSVLIGTPCMSHVPVETLASYVTLNPTPGGRISLLSGSLVYKARNDMVVNAVNGGFDYIMWLDSDMVFEPDLVWKFLADMKDGERDYVSCIAFTRQFPCEPVVYRDIEWQELETGGVRCGGDAHDASICHGTHQTTAHGAGRRWRCRMVSDVIEKIGLYMILAGFVIAVIGLVTLFIGFAISDIM